MKIQSKYRDYYDLTQGQGVQEELVFERSIVNVDISKNVKNNSLQTLAKKLYAELQNYRNSFSVGKYTVYPVIVAFCGKLYPSVYVERQWDMFIPENELQAGYFYDKESFSNFLEKQPVSKEKNLKRSLRTLFNTKDSRKSLDDFFALESNSQYENELLNEKIVIAVVSKKLNTEGNNFTINLPLKEVEFYKKMNPWQAYQELSMYLGGVVAPESKPMIKIDDKYKIMEHGFDKMSFRKAPTKVH